MRSFGYELWQLETDLRAEAVAYKRRKNLELAKGLFIAADRVRDLKKRLPRSDHRKAAVVDNHGCPPMTYQSEAIRSLIRAAGWRVVRKAPLWVSLVILAGAVLLGGR